MLPGLKSSAFRGFGPFRAFRVKGRSLGFNGFWGLDTSGHCKEGNPKPQNPFLGLTLALCWGAEFRT